MTLVSKDMDEIKTEYTEMNLGKRTVIRQGKQVVFRDEDSTGNDEDIMVDSDDESWHLVTCFCMKPFAGQPMIKCNKCNTWIHLSCAKIRKSNVPGDLRFPKVPRHQIQHQTIKPLAHGM